VSGLGDDYVIYKDFEGVIYVAGGVVRLFRDRGPNPDCADMTEVERKVAGARLWGALTALSEHERSVQRASAPDSG